MVLKHRRPQLQQSPMKAKISMSSTFWPATSPGVCDVTEKWATPRVTVQVMWLYKYPNLKYFIFIHVQSSRFAWPKGSVCFALISGTFHAINIPTGWKLSASVSTAGVDTTSRKKRTCKCAHVKYSTERRQVGKAGLICKKSNISFSGIWNSAFCVMFWRNLRLLLLFWNSLIKVYLYTWKVENARPRA